ncbi:hypothetical protein UFOVP1313_46 [uncultured Caudovirales phage]|uniref:Uncharacterized protein n=1 Tax=uncultured Caudovirales phage TaxID=2100421 RepID=A0A6J5RUQ7_9CAUD|nr:hypothetical protein UFOVP1313_46 [uncultured Caudovirales phage]
MARHSETVELGPEDNFELVAKGASNSPWHFTGSIEVEFDWVDFGIGAYEAWGQRGVDTRMGAEGVTVVGVEIHELVTFDGNASVYSDVGPPWRESPALKKMVIAALQDAIDDGGKFSESVYEKIEA